jgi:kynurenine 3-monooxygenase
MIDQLDIDSVEDALPHAYKELTIPASSDGSHRMDPNALHIWPRGGYMLIALPNLDGTFTATLFLPREGEISFAALDSHSALRALFRREFPDARDLMPNLAREFFHNPVGTLATVRCNAWHDAGHALLLGDAAHAIVPFHGQGMNCAFEDCAALDACIERFGNRWDQTFSEFESLRKPNAEAIADMALENYVEMRDSVQRRDFHLKKELGWLLEDRYPGVFTPRYSMVMFHHIPYADAQRRGAIQQSILDELCTDVDDVHRVNLTRADELVTERLRDA